MKSYEASSTIQKNPEAVWSVLTDGSKYGDWDSGIERVKGTIALGETITVYSKIAAGRAFPLKVKEFIPGQIMVWTGGMPFGLFKGVRTFSLEAKDQGTTRFTMREEFAGLILPLIWPSMPNLGPSFEQFANGLKVRAEAG
jgi:hypothetical protein